MQNVPSLPQSSRSGCVRGFCESGRFKLASEVKLNDWPAAAPSTSAADTRAKATERVGCAIADVAVLRMRIRRSINSGCQDRTADVSTCNVRVTSQVHGVCGAKSAMLSRANCAHFPSIAGVDCADQFCRSPPPTICAAQAALCWRSGSSCPWRATRRLRQWLGLADG
jgi:hypothetical protein